MKLGIITFTEGRAAQDSLRFQGSMADWLQGHGHEIVAAEDLVSSGVAAAREAERIARAGCDGVLFSFCLRPPPDFTVQAALRVDCPILLVGSSDPACPGWAGLFAAAGALQEVGMPFSRAVGDLDDPSTRARIERWTHEHAPEGRRRGEDAAQSLYGLRYGEFEGPSFEGPSRGRYAGQVDRSQWLSQFGVHVDRCGQPYLRERVRRIAPERALAGLHWLEEHCKEIRYDGPLTPGPGGTLARQVRLYLAIKDYCAEEQIAFCGLTGQLEGALLNDRADWEGPKSPILCASECDGNGALTMQLLHLLCGEPVLLADLRRYHPDRGLFDLASISPPYFSRRSEDPAANWKEVVLYPGVGGISIHFYAGPAPEVTFARITRRSGRFVCLLVRGEFVGLPREESETLGRQIASTGPRAWVRFHCDAGQLADMLACSHIHAAVGDHLGAMKAACEALDVETILPR